MSALLTLTLSEGVELRINAGASGVTPPVNIASSIALELGFGTTGELNVDEKSLSGSGLLAIPPLFFEQTRYEIEVTDSPANTRSHPAFFLNGKDLLSQRWRAGGYAFTTLNYESEVGYSRLELRRDGRLLAALRIEVFPSKLDYKTDYLELRASLETEVRMLTATLSGRTFQQRGQVRAPGGPTDLEWLIQLRELFDQWIRTIELIDRNPRRRLVTEANLVPLTQVRRPGAVTRKYLRSHPECLQPQANGPLRLAGKSWTTARLPDARRRLDILTPENLFVAHACQQVGRRLRNIQARLSHETSGAEAWQKFISSAQTTLLRLEARTFLAEIVTPEHAPSITLAMHLAPGYREFLRTWNRLLSRLTLDGDALRLSEKNVATLYELWCFVALGNLLGKELNAVPRTPDWLAIDRRGVALNLRKGRCSELVFDTNSREISVSYNRFERTPTGDCRPDNTLEIKHSGSKGRAFRYVFDAKYRLQNDEAYLENHGAPGVPVDVITKMHAYRDQIVTELLSQQRGVDEESLVWDLGNRRYIQQTVGAFALFPYAGADADQNRFFKSIHQVGVGALPFLPSRQIEVTTFVRRMLSTTDESVEDQSIELSSAEEKARIVKSHEYGLLGIVRDQDQLDYALKHRIYHMHYTAQQLRLRADFIVLMISASKARGAHGALYHAKVRSVNFGARGEIAPYPPGDANRQKACNSYVWFETEEWKPMRTPLVYSGHPPHFGFTTRLAFENARDVPDLLLVREPERRMADELRNHGATVSVFDITSSTASPFDLASLRLRLVARWPDSSRELEIRFNPKLSEFRWMGCSTSWADLMFKTQTVMDEMREMATNNSLGSAS